MAATVPLPILEELKLVVGTSYFLDKHDQLIKYSKDLTSEEVVSPAAVLLPSNSKEVARIVSICYQNYIAITIRGGGSGVSKGALAYNNTIIISLERLNRIIEINQIDRTVIVESGMITENLQYELLKHNLYFPQNIGSSKLCLIGGNVAVSSGSPKSLKYGPTKNYVLNLEVVTGNGDVIWTGKNVSKNATGFNLTQLLVGSEGTLGIITKVALQLVRPQIEALVMIAFKSVVELFECVHQIFLNGYSPSSMEFIDRTGYEITSSFLGNSFGLDKDIQGLLWIELEGSRYSELDLEIADICELIDDSDRHIFIGRTAEEIKELWSLRTQLGIAVINFSRFKDLDVVVPRSKIYEMYTAINNISEGFNLKYTAFGHVGNGNFHINILQEGKADDIEWREVSKKAITEIFQTAVQLGGTISGEHGIGNIQSPYLGLAITDSQIDLIKGIKNVFDPHHILNSNII